MTRFSFSSSQASPSRASRDATRFQFSEGCFDLDYEDDDLRFSPADVQPSTRNLGAAGLVSAGVLVLAIWTVSILGARLPTFNASLGAAQSTLTSALPAAHGDDDALPLPQNDAKVAVGALGVYHWQRDCPLEHARSLRHGHDGHGDGHDVPSYLLKKIMTRREAELHGLHPCLYCAEIEYWRSHSKNAKP